MVFLAAILISGGLCFFLLRQPPDIREYWSIRRDWDAAGQDANAATKNRLATQYLDVAHRHPGTVGGLSALPLASTHAPDTTVGKEARQQLAEQFETADIGNITAAFYRSSGQWHTIQNLAPTLLARARNSPDHPKTAQLLSEICVIMNPSEHGEPSAIYDDAADLIADRYASSPDIHHFCEILSRFHGSPPWAGRYERHLRAILQVNQDRKVRCSAQFSLASVVQVTSEHRLAEAEALFEQFCTEFDGKHSYSYQRIEKALIRAAKNQLKELQFRASGMAAPDIAGMDLDDQPMKLSDYRGRVVLLNFWATWCFPCMKLIPHEREVVAKFQGQPFDIIGVNCDDDIQKARDAVVRSKMTWRSFHNQVDGKPTITKEWNILGYPTLYLIDHHGTIRKRWVGAPRTDVLEHMVSVLVDAARRKVSPDAMQPVVAALPLPSANTNTNTNAVAAAPSNNPCPTPRHTLPGQGVPNTRRF